MIDARYVIIGDVIAARLMLPEERVVRAAALKIYHVHDR